MEGAGTIVETGAQSRNSPTGLVINYGSVSGSIRDLDPVELGEAGSLFPTRPRLADHLADSTTVRRRADAIFSAVLDGSLELTIGGRFAFETVEQAHSARSKTVT